MDPIRFAIDNPVKVTVGVILIVLFGLISLFTIPIQLTPDVDQPVITVETSWVGRSPEEVERQIVEEQEEVLRNVQGLREMRATAERGQATVTLEFELGVDIDRALQDVSNSLDEVPEYPDGADRPRITAAEAGVENPIAWVILDSPDADFDPAAFFDWADRFIKPELERVTGLAQVNIYGGREREVHVQIDPYAVAQRGVTLGELATALRQDNENFTAGQVDTGRLEDTIRVVGQFDDPRQVEQVIVRSDDAGVVRVADIASVVETVEKQRSFVRSNGRPSLAINAIRQTGANVMETMTQFRDRIDYINTTVLPTYQGDRYQVRLRQVYDETVYIDQAIGLVQTNLWLGGVLASVVLLMFLRSFRPTLIVMLAIPVSVVGTFVVMTGLGRNLNVISLAGMAFAVGMVVDNAIVVLENIDRHLKMNKSARRAAYDGAKEVWGAVLASTLTTIAVFVPVLTIQEEAGQLFRDIALAICAAVALSLLVSITVIPAASARWLKPMDDDCGWMKRVGHGLCGLVDKLAAAANGYAELIYGLTRRTFLAVTARIGIIAAATVASLAGAWLLMPPASYLPNGNQNLVFGIMLLPPSYSIEQTRTIAQRIEGGAPNIVGIENYWNATSTEQATQIQPVMDMTGEAMPAVPAIKTYFFVTFRGIVFMGAQSQDGELVGPLAPVLSNAMMGIPGAFGFASQASIFGRGIGGSASLDVDISTGDLTQLRTAADAVYMALAGRYGFQSIRPEPMNFNLPGPEQQFVIDQRVATDLGVDVQQLGVAIQAMVDGAVVGDYRLAGESVDLRVVRDPRIEMTPEQLATLPLAVIGTDGRRDVVPLSSVARPEPADSPQAINRIEQQRSVTLTVLPGDEVPLEQAQADIEEVLAGLRESGQLPPSVQTELAGTADKLDEVQTALLGDTQRGSWLDKLMSVGSSRMFLALLITFLLMAALFESFLYPLVIMFSVPLATIGGFLGLRFVHDGWSMAEWPIVGETLFGWLGPRGLQVITPSQQLDTLTMLGFVILIGVVVNNAILIVHQALNFMRGVGEGEGDETGALGPREAVRESVRSRIRPIFMTTTTSVCGMLPLVLMPGSGSELYKGLGSVVVGGLLVATVFTLLVVPLLLSLVLDLQRLVAGRKTLPGAEQRGVAVN
jgi:HAE1 family hydrophobic/amphiphilic exporter-1